MLDFKLKSKGFRICANRNFTLNVWLVITSINWRGQAAGSQGHSVIPDLLYGVEIGVIKNVAWLLIWESQLAFQRKVGKGVFMNIPLIRIVVLNSPLERQKIVRRSGKSLLVTICLRLEITQEIKVEVRIFDGLVAAGQISFQQCSTYRVLVRLKKFVPWLQIRPVVILCLLLMEQSWSKSVMCLMLGTVFIAPHGQGLQGRPQCDCFVKVHCFY